MHRHISSRWAPNRANRTIGKKFDFNLENLRFPLFLTNPREGKFVRELRRTGFTFNNIADPICFSGIFEAGNSNDGVSFRVGEFTVRKRWTYRFWPNCSGISIGSREIMKCGSVSRPIGAKTSVRPSFPFPSHY